MKAVVFHEHGDVNKLAYTDHTVPEISPSEVLVKVKACGLNPSIYMGERGNAWYYTPFTTYSRV